MAKRKEKKRNQKSRTQKRDPLIGQFFDKRKDKALAVLRLKAHRKYPQAKQIISKISKIGIDPFPDASPVNWDGVLSSNFLPPSKDWIQEFGWLIHGFLKNQKTINSFIEQRAHFGRTFLLGEYQEASSQLDTIQNACGKSLWALERSFMLLQLQEGFTAHKEALSVIQNSTSNSTIGYLATSISSKLEPHVSHSAYASTLNEELSELRSGSYDEFASVLELHLAQWGAAWKEKVSTLLNYCNRLNIVDRYDRAIRLAGLGAENLTDEADRSAFQRMVGDLKAGVDDPRLDSILHLVGDQTSAIDSKTESYLLAFDLFIRGDYADSADQAELLVLSDPTCFEFHWLLAQACACSGQPASRIPPASIAGEIQSSLRAIANNVADLNVPLETLLTLATKLGDNHLSLCLFDIVNFEHRSEPTRGVTDQLYIHSKVEVSPIWHTFLGGCNFSTNLSQAIGCETHPCVRFANYVDTSELILDEENFSQPLIAIAKTNRLLQTRQFENAITVLGELKGGLQSEREKSYFAASFAQIEYLALMGQGLLCESATCVVRHYAINPNLLRHLSFERLVELGRGGDNPEIVALPAWPILVFLNNGCPQDIYEAVDDYLAANGASSPHDLISSKIQCPPLELRILLRDVLIPEVIDRGALWCRTAAERRQMRTEGLRGLFKLSTDDQQFVIRELSKLEKQKLLEAAYRSVEGPKFRLTFSTLHEEILPVYDSIFARFFAYRSYEDSGGVVKSEKVFLEEVTADQDGERAIEGGDLETSGILLQYMATGLFSSYLCDPDNGLNATLGTRVRHGSLENQLQRSFRAYNLLAARGLDGNLRCAKQIEDFLLEIEGPDQDTIRSAFFEFTTTLSETIETAISKDLRVRIPAEIAELMEKLGIETSELKTERGLLDFSSLFSQNTFRVLEGKAPESLPALMSETENLFRETAETAFDCIRNYLTVTIAKQFDRALTKLEAAVENILENRIRAEIRQKLQAAKREFAQDLRLVSNWFADSAEAYTGGTTLSEVVDTAERVIQYASNGALGTVDRTVFDNFELSLLEREVVYEIFSALFRNIIHHSRVDAQNVTIRHQLQEFHTIEIVNQVKNKKLLRELCARANKLLQLPLEDRVLEVSPGGTGFRRIRKLFKQAGWKLQKMEAYELARPVRFGVRIIFKNENTHN